MITIQASRNELHNLLERPQLAGIPILVKSFFSLWWRWILLSYCVGHQQLVVIVVMMKMKRFLETSIVLDETGLIDIMMIRMVVMIVVMVILVIVVTTVMIVVTWWWKSKVLGNKRDLPGALDETGLIERMGLSAVQVGIGKTITTIIIIITINQSRAQRRHHLQYQHLSHQNHHHTLDHNNYNYFQDNHHLITTGPGDLLLLDQLQGKRQHWYHITGKKQTNQTGNLPKKYSWKLSYKKNTVMEKSKIVNWKILIKYTPVVDSTQQVRRPGPIRYFIVV